MCTFIYLHEKNVVGIDSKLILLLGLDYWLSIIKVPSSAESSIVHSHVASEPSMKFNALNEFLKLH